MIASLNGKLKEKNPPEVVVECCGVGYQVDVPMSTFYNLPELGENVQLYTAFIVREDAQLLFGFLKKAEKALFLQLLKVSGIGPRTALAMLSSMSVADLENAITNGESALLTKIPGIGKKTAERLVLELKDKIVASGPVTALTSSQADILSALTALGFNEREARTALKNLPEGVDTSEGIRLALVQLAK